MMVKLALEYPEYRDNAKRVRLVKTTAGQYYGKGYQDVQNRVPKISQSTSDLDWKPRFNMQQALKLIFDAYRTHVAEARRLVE
jgi:nucleoside-diphosphate-sugar epimerase